MTIRFRVRLVAIALLAAGSIALGEELPKEPKTPPLPPAEPIEWRLPKLEPVEPEPQPLPPAEPVAIPMLEVEIPIAKMGKVEGVGIPERGGFTISKLNWGQKGNQVTDYKDWTVSSTRPLMPQRRIRQENGRLVEEWLIPPPIVPEPEPGGRVVWRDGQTLPGYPIGLEGTRLQWQSPRFAEPLVLDTRSLQSLWIESEPPPDATSGTDRLVFSDGLESSGSVLLREGAIRWRPAGGFTFSPLVPGQSASVFLDSAVASKAVDRKAFPATTYLIGGDVLPCRAVSCDEAFLDIVTPLGDARRIPVESVKAVELEALHDGDLGVGDFDWKVKSKGKNGIKEVQEKSEFVELDAGRNRMAFRAKCYVSTPRFPEIGPLSTRCFVQWPDNPVGSHLYVQWTSPTDDNQRIASAVWVHLTVQSKQEVRAEIVLVKSGTVGRVAQKNLPINPDLTSHFSMVVRDGALERVLIDKQDIHQQVGGPPEKPCDELQIVASAGVVVSGLVVRATGDISVDEQARLQTLVVPRFRRENPSTHVLVAPNGDLLRGRFLGLDEKAVRFRSGKEELTFDRSRVTTLVWLHPEGPPAESDAKSDAKLNAKLDVKSDVTPDVKLDTKPDANPVPELIQARLEGNNLVTLAAAEMTDEALTGNSSILGPCTIPRGMVRELRVGRHDEFQDIPSYANWVQSFAISPRRLDSELGTVGVPVGKEAGTIDLPLLEGGRFKMSESAGQVVVLSFWASWCAPCVTGIPMCAEAVEEFDPSEVRFVALNQGESAELARELVDRHGWKVDVALDVEELTAKQLGIDTIPHTLVIDKTGIVRRSQSGFGPRTGDELRQAIEELVK